MAAEAYAGPIRLVLFDVDGVLTDGRLHVGPEGELFKTFHVHDGIGVAVLRAHGIRSGILSGKASTSLDYRAKELKFDVAVTGRLDKLAAYAAIKAQLGVDDHQVAYVGDDVLDLPVMRLVAASYAPADAHALVLAEAGTVTARAGGAGVAREVAEHVLLAGGLALDAIYAPLLGDPVGGRAVQ